MIPTNTVIINRKRLDSAIDEAERMAASACSGDSASASFMFFALF